MGENIGIHRNLAKMDVAPRGKGHRGKNTLKFAGKLSGHFSGLERGKGKRSGGGSKPPICIDAEAKNVGIVDVDKATILRQE